MAYFPATILYTVLGEVDLKFEYQIIGNIEFFQEGLAYVVKGL